MERRQWISLGIVVLCILGMGNLWLFPFSDDICRENASNQSKYYLLSFPIPVTMNCVKAYCVYDKENVDKEFCKHEFKLGD